MRVGHLACRVAVVIGIIAVDRILLPALQGAGTGEFLIAGNQRRSAGDAAARAEHRGIGVTGRVYGSATPAGLSGSYRYRRITRTYTRGRCGRLPCARWELDGERHPHRLLEQHDDGHQQRQDRQDLPLPVGQGRRPPDTLIETRRLDASSAGLQPITSYHSTGGAGVRQPRWWQPARQSQRQRGNTTRFPHSATLFLLTTPKPRGGTLRPTRTALLRRGRERDACRCLQQSRRRFVVGSGQPGGGRWHGKAGVGSGQLFDKSRHLGSG